MRAITQLFKQREGKEEDKKSRFGTLIFVSMEYLLKVSHLKYGFVGEDPPTSLFVYVWVRRTHLCIKVIFVGVSSVFLLVLGFGWKFQVKRGKPAEIVGEYRY